MHKSRPGKKEHTIGLCMQNETVGILLMRRRTVMLFLVT